MPTETAPPELSWTGLTVGPDGLVFGGAGLLGIARAMGTPTYVYDAARVRASVAALREALGATGLDHRMLYAMKANRFPPLLALLRREGDVGIDACSPREVERALQLGFLPSQISFTGGMLSNGDLDRLVKSGVHLNLDSRSVLRRLAERVPAGTSVGLRVDPGISAGYGDLPKLAYGNTKFGFLWEDMPEVIQLCASLGLVVDTLHLHPGWGLQSVAQPLVEGVLARLAALAAGLPGVHTLNLGGGLGARRRREDQPLHPAALVPAIRRHLGALGKRVALEPGTFLVDAAGLLLVEVNTIEQKGDITWVGVDAGHAINVYAAHYELPPSVFLVERPGAPLARRYNLAGHINEANDVFVRGALLPELREGDHLALFPGGAYGSSMASDHCLRGEFAELLLDPNPPRS